MIQIVLQNHDFLQLPTTLIPIVCIWGFSGKEDTLSKYGSFVILSGKALGLEGSDLLAVAATTATSLPQVGRGSVPTWERWTSWSEEPVGAAFSTLGSFEECGLGCPSFGQRGCLRWGPVMVSLRSSMSEIIL